MIKITECPRDAMQGLKDFIPTRDKVNYLNLLLKVGYHRIDFGSFVSPKAIPQLADTAEVIEQLETEGSSSALLAIVANTRGAQEAAQFDKVDVLGFPFSVSETFQMRNTNRSISESLTTVEEIVSICSSSNQKKIPLVYLSMGFGNPYGDAWNFEVVARFAGQLIDLGVNELVLADTIGKSDPASIEYLFPLLKHEFPTVTWALHLHSTPDAASKKLESALRTGCEHFDTAIRGYGGCPMADDVLTGNVATESLLDVLKAKCPESLHLDFEALERAQAFSHKIFH